MKKKNLLVGASALLLMASMNLGHAFNEYGFLNGNLCGSILAQTTSGSGGGSSTGGNTSSGGTSSSGTSSSPGADSSNNYKSKYYLKVKCKYLFKCPFNGSGSVIINGVTIKFVNGVKDAEVPINGSKERCTGGNDWYDCERVQTECLPSSNYL